MRKLGIIFIIMKYNILINQVKAIEWDLSSSEAILFAWLYELPSWAEKMLFEGETYYFANRGLACEEVPLVSTKKDTIYRIYKSLQKKGLISFVFVGGKDFIAINEKGKEWHIDYIRNSEKNPSYGEKFKKAEINPIDNIYKNKEDNHKEIEKDKSFSKKEQKDELFEKCWEAYRRKGAKAKAKVFWDKLTDEEKKNVLPHIKAYASSREQGFQKDFERYLRDKIFETIVIGSDKKTVIYDPARFNDKEYRPETSPLLFWNEIMKCYLYIGSDMSMLFDGYEADNRPDGATVVLNNGRGTIVWSKETKQWIKR